MKKSFREIYVPVFLAVLLALSIYNTYMIHSMQISLGSSLSSVGRVPQNIIQVPQNATYSIVEKSIPIVAVSSDGEGVVGSVTLKLIPGNNNVLINTNPFLETDLQYSANKAVAVAKLRTEYNYDKDFIFDFKSGGAQLIGGGSAGSAMTILTMASLEGKKLRNDTVITGTINTDGTIGMVGGIMEKAKAVADAGYKYFLVPEGQATVTYYEREVTREPFGFGFTILNTRYVPKTIDLKKVAREEWGLNIVEVSTIDEAYDFFTGE